MTKTQINPLTEEPMSSEANDRVTEAKQARANAKKDARSGNPAKREPAKRLLKNRVFSKYIKRVYEVDAQ